MKPLYIIFKIGLTGTFLVGAYIAYVVESKSVIPIIINNETDAHIDLTLKIIDQSTDTIRYKGLGHIAPRDKIKSEVMDGTDFSLIVHYPNGIQVSSNNIYAFLVMKYKPMYPKRILAFIKCSLSNDY